jgi:hypothetical protein
MAIAENDLKNIQSETSEHGETIRSLTNDSNFQKKTVLSGQLQAQAFASLWSIAEENDISFLKHWLKNNADWLLSVGGKCRNDIVEVSKFKGESNLSMSQRFLEIMGKR